MKTEIAEQGIELGRASDLEMKALVAHDELVRAYQALRQSERALRDFVENAPLGLHWVGPDGEILWANQTELDLLGYRREEYVGHHVAEFHADAPVIQDILSRLCAGETLRDYEARLRCKDGGIRHVMISSNVLFEQGKFVHTRCFTRDITDRKIAERALRESERRFREMIDALPTAIYTTDAEGRLTHFNPAAAEFAGRTPELGSDHWCVSWKMYRADGTPLPHDECPMAIALKEGRPVRGVEAMAERPDGRRIWFTPYPTPLRDAEGKIVGGINMLVDITERKEAERRLRANLAITEVLAESPGIDDGVHRVLEIVGKALGWQVGAFWMPDAEAKVLRCLDVWRADPTMAGKFEAESRKRRFPVGIGLPGRVWANLKPAWIPDATQDDNFPRAPFAVAEGLHAAFAFPILFGERFLGVMEFFSDEIRQPDEALLVMFGTIGGQIGQFIERRRAEQKLADAARIQGALYEFVERRHRAESFVEIYDAALDAILTALQCDRAAILLSDRTGVMRFVGWRGLSDGYRKAVEGHSPWKPEETDARPISIDDIEAAEISDALKEVVTSEGIHALAFIPLVSHGRLIGKFMTYFNTPHRFSADETELSLTIARQLAFGIDRKRAEEALRESEARKSAMFQTALDSIISIDAEGKIVEFNPAAERTFGYRREDVLGQSMAELIIPPSLRERHRRGMAHYLAGGEARVLDRRIELFAMRADGSEFPIELTVTRISSEGAPLFTAYLRDITERKQAKERLEQTVAERTAALQATNEQLEAFVYSIAHDLRAPLRSMNAFSQLLIDDHSGELNEGGQKMLRRIQASSEFMDRLLLDLLAYGRTARAELELGSVEVRRAWESALFQANSQIEQTGARIETIGQLPAVRAHEATLGQVLANLLSNALKFVGSGVQPHVRFRAEDCGSSVRLWVEDNGVGIPADQHERVFRVFERLNGSRYPGTGIGLSIVRKGVERMGGKVGLDSEPGKGSRFWIELTRA